MGMNWSKKNGVKRWHVSEWVEKIFSEVSYFFCVPPNHLQLDHFSVESHGDLGIPHFKKHP